MHDGMTRYVRSRGAQDIRLSAQSESFSLSLNSRLNFLTFGLMW